MLLICIPTNYHNTSEYFDKAIELNMLVLNNIDKVIIDKKISKKININKEQVPSANLR